MSDYVYCCVDFYSIFVVLFIGQRICDLDNKENIIRGKMQKTALTMTIYVNIKMLSGGTL